MNTYVCKVTIWDVNCTRVRAYTIDWRMDNFEKQSLSLMQNICGIPGKMTRHSAGIVVMQNRNVYKNYIFEASSVFDSCAIMTTVDRSFYDNLVRCRKRESASYCNPLQLNHIYTLYSINQDFAEWSAVWFLGGFKLKFNINKTSMFAIADY